MTSSGVSGVSPVFSSRFGIYFTGEYCSKKTLYLKYKNTTQIRGFHRTETLVVGSGSTVWLFRLCFLCQLWKYSPCQLDHKKVHVVPAAVRWRWRSRIVFYRDMSNSVWSSGSQLVPVRRFRSINRNKKQNDTKTDYRVYYDQIKMGGKLGDQ